MRFIPFLVAALLLSASAATAQTPVRSLELGIRGGGTFTHGYTTIPAQTITSAVQVPEIKNQNNGIGYGYSAGVWGRKNFRTFFVQVEGTYNRFVLRQKTSTTLDVNANPALVRALPISVAPGLINASINAVTESVLESVDVPVLFGKRFLGGRLRGYLGPDFIFVQKAQLTQTNAGTINANAAVGFSQEAIPATTSTTDLLNKYTAQNLQVKTFTYAAQIGVGISPLKFLDVDLRYAVPVGGVYKDSNIKGFLGIATATVGLKVF